MAAVPSAIDSCLWILHDWADGLLLTAVAAEQIDPYEETVSDIPLLPELPNADTAPRSFLR